MVEGQSAVYTCHNNNSVALLYTVWEDHCSVKKPASLKSRAPDPRVQGGSGAETSKPSARLQIQHCGEYTLLRLTLWRYFQDISTSTVSIREAHTQCLLQMALLILLLRYTAVM